MAGFVALLQALPAMVSLMQEVSRFLKQTLGDDPGKFMNDSAEAFRKLNDAKTTEDRIDALNRLQSLLNRLGKP